MFRVGSRQSATWTAGDAVAVALELSSGWFQRCQTSYDQPDVGRPASSSSAAASSSDETIDQKCAELPLDRLERDANACALALVGDRPDPVDHGRRRSSPGPVRKRTAVGLERREPPDPGADGLDPLGGVVGALHQRQRQDRRHLRDGRRRLERSDAEPLERVVASSFISQIPIPSAPGGAVGVEVVGEGLADASMIWEIENRGVTGARVPRTRERACAQRRLQQLVRDERARAGAEPGPG